MSKPDKEEVRLSLNTVRRQILEEIQDLSESDLRKETNRIMEDVLNYLAGRGLTENYKIVDENDEWVINLDFYSDIFFDSVVSYIIRMIRNSRAYNHWWGEYLPKEEDVCTLYHQK